jgi:hypothetical protein
MDDEFEKQRLCDQIEDLKDEVEKIKRESQGVLCQKQSEVDRINLALKDLENRYEQKLNEQIAGN